jgi:hypothetical protein
MISLLLTLLVLILVFGAIFAVLQYVVLPHPFKQIAYIILSVLFVIILIAYLLPLGGVRVL